ncbi:MAG TPA: MDR family MFS transporter [Candidatus Baltobacterales bacterium]|nr:MDR family MFS transporter [Candidatus Baltobacterales bacterium]
MRITAGLMLAMLVAAMDATVVATGLPTIGKDLHGLSLYPWIFAGYLLTSTTTVPLWGRLADIYGRKNVLMAGLVVFVGASALCGTCSSMQMLVVFRVLQGVGAGCLQPVVITTVGDLFPLEQRARVQGLFSAMWGIAALTGPLIGAVFVTTIGWRWIFEVNVPLGIAVVALIWSFHDRPAAGGARDIDWLGAVLLTTGIALALVGLGAGGAAAQIDWRLEAAALGLLAWFVYVERGAARPTVPLRLLRHPLIGPALLAALAAGTLQWAATSYIPLYTQDVLGMSAYWAGASVAPMSLGWPLASVIAGRLLIRVGPWPLAFAGSVALVAGALMIATASSVQLVVAASAVLGFGMGMMQTPLLVTVQSSVGWAERGATTALNQFARTIGGSVGVSLLGLLLVSPGASTQGAALGPGLHAVFWTMPAMAAASVLVCVAMLAISRRRQTAPATS